ncbi:MAG: tetratricopeptide repeat protein [Melioribacteraceae bacterium]
MTIKNKILLITILSIIFGSYAQILSQIKSAIPKVNNNKIRLAKNYEQSGKLDKAKNIYSELLQQEPTNLQYYKGLNQILLKLKDYTSSINLINNRIDTTPNNISLYGDLGSTYFLKGEQNKAFEIWNKGLTFEPENAYAYRLIANYMIENRAIENAIEILNKGNEVSENHTQFSYDVANLYSMTMKYEQATNEYCKILDIKPKQLNIIRQRILQYIHATSAKKPILKIVKNYYNDSDKNEFLELLANLYLKTNNIEKAFESFVTLEEETTKNGSKLFNFARQAVRMKKNEIASKAYNKIINEYPNSSLIPNAKIGYAKTLEASIENSNSLSNQNGWKPLQIKAKEDFLTYEKIIIAYRDLAKTYPNNKVGAEAEFRVGKIYLDKLLDYKKSESIFTKIRTTTNIIEFANKAIYELSKIEIVKNNLSIADNYLEKLYTNKRTEPKLKSDAKFLSAKIKMWNNEIESSIKLLNEVKDNYKDENSNDALEFLLLLNTFKNDSTNLNLFLIADNLVMQNNFNLAAEKFKLLSENENLFILKDIAALNYAKILIALNEYTNANIFLEKIANCDVANIYADKFLFLWGINYNFGLQQQDKAVATLTLLLDKYPNSIYFEKARKIISEIKTNGNS